VHISSVHMSSKYSYRVVPVPRKIPVYSKENTIKKIHVTDDSVRHTLEEANHNHTCSKMVSPRRQGKYTLKEREKMGMYATENSQPGLLDASLSLRLQSTVLHQTSIIMVMSFLIRGTKFKICQIKNAALWPNYNA